MSNEEKYPSNADRMASLTSEKSTDVVEHNKKPNFMMRIAGGLIDLCLLFLAIFGFNQLILNTPMTDCLRTYENKINMVIDSYKLKPLVEGSDETYAFKMYEDDENYAVNSKKHIIYFDEELNKHYVVVDNETISEVVANATKIALNADKEYKNLSFDYRLMDYGFMMFSGFIAMSVFLLVVPLIDKKRRTIGKLAAGTMLVDSKYHTPARWFQVVGRFAWQFLIEGALIYLLLSSMILHMLIVPVALFLISLIDRKKGRTLHDFISRTMVIDSKTYLPISKEQRKMLYKI